MHTIPAPLTQRLFRHDRTSELVRRLLLLRAASSPTVSALASRVITRSSNRPLLSPLVNSLVRSTVFPHFCGGETRDECQGVVRQLRKRAVGSILNYSVEGGKRGEQGFDEAARVVRGAVESAWSEDDSEEQREVGKFVSVKASAVGRVQLLEKVNRVIKAREANAFEDGVMTLMAEELEQEEWEEFRRVLGRLESIAEAAQMWQVPLLVDAEEYAMCHAVDLLSFELLKKFNRDTGPGGRQPTVYVTMQMYLKDAAERLAQAVKAARNAGFILGVKAVRGAYLVHERREAKAVGGESPVWDTIDETHASFDRGVAKNIGLVAEGNLALIVATHNEKSLRCAGQAADLAGVTRDSPCLHFAQLYGMRDSLTLAVAQAGFNVLKCIPFGPVGETMPYLMRRLEENRDILGGTPDEIAVLVDELQHRHLLPSY